jgi:heterodisulfide reductase subunit C
VAAYPDLLLDEFARLAEECRPCYQCGQCTSSCPSGRELDRGPRRIVRLVLAGDVDAVLGSDDLWRCTECGSCTANCRMDIDVTSVLARLRALDRQYGTTSCPERAAADLAAQRLGRRPRIDNMQFGVAMARKGHLPKDKVGAVEMGVKLARQMLPLPAKKRPGGEVPGSGDTLTMPFYAGCAVPQDHELHALVREVAAGFGVSLAEDPEAGCCGHPSRGAVGARFTSAERVHTACPACDAGLKEAGVDARPLWHTLTDHARRRGIAISAGAASFVPYVGCLTERDVALDALRAAGEQSGAAAELSFPTLHSGCCGALGGMYRGATQASERLLGFAAQRQAPVVTTCVLCRDNLRSAARQLKLDVPVHFWPEFFRAAGPAAEEKTHD